MKNLLDMDVTWKKVYSAPFEYPVEVLRAKLERKGIPAVVLNKKDSAYHFGEVELFTTQEHVLQAINLIKKENQDA